MAAYWCQFLADGGGKTGFLSADANNALNEIDQRVGHITNAFKPLREKKPAAFVIQTGKGSGTKARKNLKVTPAGKRHVEDLIKGAADGE